MRARHLYEFDCFRLDCHEGVLLSEGRRLRLEPKDLELLRVLVENHGHTAGKEELLEKVWPATFVEEGNLARHISVLRQVLSQGQNGTQYIETIPKRGYRFVAPVREVDLSLAEDAKGDASRNTHRDFSARCSPWRSASATARSLKYCGNRRRRTAPDGWIGIA